MLHLKEASSFCPGVLEFNGLGVVGFDEAERSRGTEFVRPSRILHTALSSKRTLSYQPHHAEHLPLFSSQATQIPFLSPLQQEHPSLLLRS
jgi:hypothetical protein